MRRRPCLYCNNYFTAADESTVCPKCADEKDTVMMNLNTAALRMNTVRQRLMEKAAEGKLGVIAARSNMAEFRLKEWCDSPLNSPNAAELSRIQEAIEPMQLALAAAESTG